MAGTWRILLQSERNCKYLEESCDAFLVTLEQDLRSMTDETFKEHEIGLVNKRLEKLKNLGQETSRFWTHNTSEVFDFEQGTFATFQIFPIYVTCTLTSGPCSLTKLGRPNLNSLSRRRKHRTTYEERHTRIFQPVHPSLFFNSRETVYTSYCTGIYWNVCSSRRLCRRRRES